MTDVLFTAADVAEMRAFSDANLPHTAGLRQGTKTFEPGGTGGAIAWAGGDPTWAEPCRVSPASTPQERLSSGSDHEPERVLGGDAAGRERATEHGGTVSTYYRLEVTHDIPGLTSPLMLYLKGTPSRSYEMLRKVLCTTEAPK
jgi:hypothetical protein